MEGTPFVAFSNESLVGQPKVSKGDLTKCKDCTDSHPLEYGTKDGIEDDLLGFYHCPISGNLYLASIKGASVFGAGAKPDMSGEI
jgi:hypothetical protein